MGGISAPGNAPWVLTVGGSSTNGTPQRSDDLMGTYSSRGSNVYRLGGEAGSGRAGTGTVSLASAGSNFYLTKGPALLPGLIATASLPYLSLTGTSMAAPVVTGVVALMLQANPNLTPNGVKAILQYTAEKYPGYDSLTQGAGFLNAVGAVRLARFYATAQPGDRDAYAVDVEQAPHLGQSRADQRVARREGERVCRRHCVGRREDVR